MSVKSVTMETVALDYLGRKRTLEFGVRRVRVLESGDGLVLREQYKHE